MDTPDSAPSSDCGLLEYASILIKVVIGLTMIVGLASNHASSQGLHPLPRSTAGQPANIVSC